MGLKLVGRTIPVALYRATSWLGLSVRLMRRTVTSLVWYVRNRKDTADSECVLTAGEETGLLAAAFI
jgi:hypothetical protein